MKTYPNFVAWFVDLSFGILLGCFIVFDMRWCLSVVRLSFISYQLSVISYQLSVISYQLSVISYQLSVRNLSIKAFAFC